MTLSVTSIGSNSGKSVASVVITLGANIPANCCIFVAMSTAGSSVTTNIADSFGQTHWVGGNGLATANGSVLLDWCWNASAMNSGNTITVTPSAGGNFTCSVYAWYVTGISIAANPVDASQTTSGNGTAPSMTTGTLVQAAEYVVGAIAVAGPSSETFTNDSNYNVLPSYRVGTTGGSDTTINVGMKTVMSTSAVTFAPTLGTAENYAGYMATFKVVDVSPSITGVAGTGAAGTTVAQDSKTLTGVAGTGGVGTVTPQVGGVLVGAASTTAPGTFTPSDKGYLIGAQTNCLTGVWNGQSYTRGSVATYYNSSGVLTTASANVIRTDNYDPNTLVDTGLLVESQSTNYCIQGTTVQTSNWGASAVTATNNATTSPDGTSNATLVTQNSANSEHYYQQQPVASGTSIAGQTATFSVYVKANGVRYVGLHFFDAANPGSAIFGVFDLTSVLSAVSNNGTSSGGTASITTINNGWYRISVSGSVTSIHSSAGGFIARISHHSSFSTGAFSFTGDGTSGCYVYGAQVELGALSSFIPTTTAAVTRAADLQGWPATISQTLTGVAATGAAGTETPSVSKTLGGVAGTGAAGTLTPQSGGNIILSGVATSALAGTMTPSIAKALSGIASTTAAGTIIRGLMPQGVASTSAAGTFSIGQVVNLIGAASTTAVGGVTPKLSIPLVGAPAYAVAGYYSNKPTRLQIELPTTVSTARAGTFSVTTVSGLHLVGVASITHAGTMNALRNILLTGAAMHGQAGAYTVLGFGAGLFFDDLLVQCTPAISLDTYVSLRWSDDKGATWSFPLTRSLGQGGEYLTSLLWRRLGMGRDRIFEISFTAPANTSLTGVWYETVESQS